MKPAMLPALLFALSLSTPALAQSADPVPDPGVPAPAATVSDTPPIVAQIVREVQAVHEIVVRAPRLSTLLSDTELDTQRGGQAIVITNQTMNSIASGNIMNGDYSAGSVALSDFALSNFNGVGNLLINTGAQVSAQSGMNLTINLGD